MFFYPKMKTKFAIVFTLILLAGNCKESNSNSNQNESYESYIRKNTHLMCEKLLYCYTSITRTFPVEIQKEVSIENCESSALVDLDEKLQLHTETMKTLSKGCYEKLLNADCKDFLTFAYADTSCYMLNKESEKVYGNAAKIKNVKK